MSGPSSTQNAPRAAPVDPKIEALQKKIDQETALDVIVKGHAQECAALLYAPDVPGAQPVDRPKLGEMQQADNVRDVLLQQQIFTDSALLQALKTRPTSESADEAETAFRRRVRDANINDFAINYTLHGPHEISVSLLPSLEGFGGSADVQWNQNGGGGRLLGYAVVPFNTKLSATVSGGMGGSVDSSNPAWYRIRLDAEAGILFRYMPDAHNTFSWGVRAQATFVGGMSKDLKTNIAPRTNDAIFALSNTISKDINAYLQTVIGILQAQTTPQGVQQNANDAQSAFQQAIKGIDPSKPTSLQQYQMAANQFAQTVSMGQPASVQDQINQQTWQLNQTIINDTNTAELDYEHWVDTNISAEVGFDVTGELGWSGRYALPFAHPVSLLGGFRFNGQLPLKRITNDGSTLANDPTVNSTRVSALAQAGVGFAFPGKNAAEIRGMAGARTSATQLAGQSFVVDPRQYTFIMSLGLRF